MSHFILDFCIVAIILFWLDQMQIFLSSNMTNLSRSFMTSLKNNMNFMSWDIEPASFFDQVCFTILVSNLLKCTRSYCEHKVPASHFTVLGWFLSNYLTINATQVITNYCEIYTEHKLCNSSTYIFKNYVLQQADFHLYKSAS